MAQLEGPPIPYAIEYLWDWFNELERGRGIDMNGPSPITYESIDSWARLTDRNPKPYEVNALFILDAVSRNPNSGGTE